jgi:hypothetical protein
MRRNLRFACYGIISTAGNTVTTVTIFMFLERFESRYSRSKPFHWQSENIADAALGLNHTWCTRTSFQFAPQPQDLNVHASIENICMNSCHLQQVLPRERALRCFKKRHEQGKFALAQRDLRLIGGH